MNLNITCKFCDLKDFEYQIVFESSNFYTILPRKIIGSGYFIVFPKRHFNSLEMSIEEFEDFKENLNSVIDLFNRKFETTEYNLFCNIGKSADQHIEHLHFHVFARKNNEDYNPLDKLNKQSLINIPDQTKEDLVNMVDEYKKLRIISAQE